MTKSKARCNILVCGTMSSGSSAMHNLLKEYDNIGHFSMEFDDYRAPGLVADQLDYSSSINFPNQIDKVIKNSNFIKRLLFRTLLWDYFFKCIPKRYLDINYNNRKLEKLQKKIIETRLSSLLRQLNKSLKKNISFEEKIQLSNQWIHDIGNVFSIKKEYTLFDQPLTNSFSANWTSVFNPYKLIIVYRNPLDQIADMINRRILFLPYGAPYMTIAGDNLEAIYGRDRKGAIRFQLDAIKRRLEWIDYLKKTLDQDHLLVLDFEGLVNNYSEYKSKVEGFLGLTKDNHKFKNRYFDPIKSKENVGLFKKHLSEDEIKDLSDIEVKWENLKLISQYELD